VTEKADSLRTAIDAKRDIWHLKAEEIKEELAAQGKVVRQQTRELAAEVKDATQDAATTAEIKRKYAMDKEVPALSISVNTTEGVVTLSGTAPSYEAISKAMMLAMETEGVRQVVSTIQVKKD
jgi:osmotically-inducible protein OsmY